MDSVPNHLIRRQILEFRGVRESDARQLQEEISRLFYEKILPILDQYLSEHSPNDVIHRIERLELDIGTVSRNNFERDFIKKVIAQLEIYFEPQEASDSNFRAEKEEIPAEKSHLEIFGFFVETGNLPWWADRKDKDPVKESLDFLIRKEKNALRQLMQKWVREPAALKRIVIQTGFPKWAEIAAVNLDCSGEELTYLLSQTMDLLKKITPWRDYPKHQLQEFFGLKFLQWVFSSPRKMQNTADFWRGFLMQLTSEQTVKYDEIFAEFFLQFEKNEQGESEKEKEYQSDSDAFSWENKTPRESLRANTARRIKRLLEAKNLDPESEIQWLERLEKFNEQAFEEEDLRRIIQLLEPTETAEKDSALTKNPDQNEVFKKKLDKFSDTDELFVGNAGLVILAPYLNRFFENLNLLDNRRFANVAAAHRAVGLLQFLADGTKIPAEHRCGLNKILCGLDAETVLEFGEPVTAEEAEACETLLAAVVANAPILGEMSLDGFRGSFLIRKGILCAGVGAWQLNVERETFDVVLARFPWTWNIVKLPWMPWAISVEWI